MSSGTTKKACGDDPWVQLPGPFISPDSVRSYSVSGFNANNNSIDGNITKITDNGWHINVKGAINQSVTDSAIAKGVESDGSKNHQLNLNANKWFSEKLKFKSVIYSRNTKSDYDKSKSVEESVTSENNMYAIQAGLENKNIIDFKSNIIIIDIRHVVYINFEITTKSVYIIYRIISLTLSRKCKC